ncbi:MAG: EscE/YscE/SsaE family type III secretion system needle protein co-chaperone [Endozoicomonadaceae bacterium]|nr:EscE/YscE/SsaE family type III secretion system needle protein co-chaperone [Endozoicomonadaceae bacterium]MCY4329899.1 EscE/YscE/SsaE family type III secretion system needle protein co-chaperone [Endozoicomonadaceae bacterium]
MNENLLSLSAIEDELLTDEDGSKKADIVDQMEAEINRLKKANNQGLSPEEFEQANSLITAMEESIKVIEMTWAKHHLTDKQLH